MVTRWGQDEGHIDSRRVAQTATNELGKEPVLSRAAVHGRASYPTCFSDCPCMSDTVREKTETLKGTASKSARLIWWDKGKGPGEINADEINAKRIPQRYAIIGPRNWSFCCQLFLNAGRNKPQGATMKLPDILSPQAEDDEGSSSKGGNLLYFIIEYVAGRPWSLCTWLKDTAKFLSHNSGLWCWSGSYVCSHQQHDQWEKHWNHAAGHLIFLGIYKTLMWWLWWIFDGFRPHKLHGMRFCLSQAAKTGLCSRSQCLLIFSVGMCRWRSIKIWNIMKWYWRVLECLIVIFLGFCSVSTTPSPWGSVRTFLKKTYAW